MRKKGMVGAREAIIMKCSTRIQRGRRERSKRTSKEKKEERKGLHLSIHEVDSIRRQEYRNKNTEPMVVLFLSMNNRPFFSK